MITESTAQLLERLFGSERLEDVSVDQLKELVDEYPSFNVGHYLLSKKLLQGKDDLFLPETQKTALYFYNPFWLQWLLQHNSEEEPKKEPLSEPGPEQVTEEASTDSGLLFYDEEGIEKNLSISPEALTQVATTEIEERVPGMTDDDYTGQEVATGEEIYQEGIAAVSHEEAVSAIYQPEIAEEITSGFQQTSQTEEAISNEASVPESIPSEPFHETAKEDQDRMVIKEEAAVFNFHLPDNGPQQTDYQPMPAADRPMEIKEEYPAAEIPHEDSREDVRPADHDHDESRRDQLPPFMLPEEETEEILPKEETATAVAPEFQPVGIDREESMTDRNFHEAALPDHQEEPTTISAPIEADQEETTFASYPGAGIEEKERSGESSVLEPVSSGQQQEKMMEDHQPGLLEEQLPSHDDEQAQTDEENSPGDPAKIILPELVFEPYHTIDYFASQGIRFIPDENPTDKFGKQLKSFTDWLKMMKKLPQKALPEEPDDIADAEIQTIAANSIEEKDVLTEAMAEVLAKQGRIDSAIELYLKLSLLNPIKIAYFAAKIEELKKTVL